MHVTIVARPTFAWSFLTCYTFINIKFDRIFTQFYGIHRILINLLHIAYLQSIMKKNSYERFLLEKGKEHKSTYSRSILLTIMSLGRSTIQKKVIIIKVLIRRIFMRAFI